MKQNPAYKLAALYGNMLRHLFVFFFFTVVTQGRSQCPLLYDYLGNLSATPLYINCSGGNYALNLQSNSGWGTYTVNWGDGSAVTTGTSYAANSTIPHTYAAATSTYVITLTIGSACTRTALVVMERPVTASIQVPISSSLACAPRTLTFTNASLNVSSTTSFTWTFGDGSPAQIYDHTNSGQSLVHTYQKGTVNCQTTATLLAENYCSFGIPAFAYNGPINIYDIDDAQITVDQQTRCWPDNQFTFTNATNRNCVPQGNINQRYELWHIDDYWNQGHDSIIGWNTWPPSTPLTLAFPAVGNYPVSLLDSNMCGIDPAVIVVQIVNPPTASLVVPQGNLCQNTVLTFTNASTAGQSYLWNFGKGGGFVNLGNGNKTQSYNTPGTYTVKLVSFVTGAGNACRDTATAVITILAAPIASFSLSPAAGCGSLYGVTFTNNSTGATTYSWTFNNGNTSTAASPPPQNYLATGNHSVILRAEAATGCTHTAVQTLTVRPLPLPDFNTFAACVGSPVSFSNNSTPTTGPEAIISYSWNFGDGNSSALPAPTHSYSAPNTYSVRLVAASAYCTDSIVKTITVNIKPSASFTVQPTVACPPFAATFTNTSSNAISYLWRFGAGTSTSSAVHPVFTFNNGTTSSQNHAVRLIASTGIGCADSTEQVLTVLPRPVADFTSNIAAGCSPFTVTFTNTTMGATTYTWNFGDGGGSSLQHPAHSYTNNSLFQQTVSVNMIASNSAGCTDTITKPLIVYAKPDVSVTMVPSSGCHPLVINFPAVPGVATYTWDHGDGSPKYITTSAPHTHTFINTGTVSKAFTISLLAANVSGCADSAKGIALVHPKPIAGFTTTPSAGCSPLNTTLNVTDNLVNSLYLFRFGDGQNTAAGPNASVTHVYTNPSFTGNQTFTSTVVVTSVNGCKDSLSSTFLVFSKPDAQFVADTPRCASSSVSFTNQSTGGQTHHWDFGDNSLFSVQQHPVHSYTINSINNQTFPVTLIVTSPNNCKDTTTRQVTVYSLPRANALISHTAGCSPHTATLTSTSLYAHSVSWITGDGTFSGQPAFTHTFINPSQVSDQIFTVQVIALNNNGCSDTARIPVLVHYKPEARLSHSNPDCKNSAVSFFNTSLGTVTQNWAFGDGGNNGAPNPVHTYSNGGISDLTFTASLIVSSGAGCSDTAYAYLLVPARPVADFTAVAFAACAPFNAVLTNSSINAHKNLWKFGDGSVSTASATTHLFLNSSGQNQIHNVSLAAYNNNGCRDSTTKSFTIIPQPLASFEADTPVCSPKTVLFTNRSSGAASFQWSLGNGQTSASGGTVSQLYVNGSQHVINVPVSLIATSASGCSDTSEIWMPVYPKLNIAVISRPDSGCSPLMVRFQPVKGVKKHFWTFEPGNYSEETEANNVFVNNGNSPKTFTVTLIAENAQQCRDTSASIIKVFPGPTAKFTANPLEVYIPNEQVKCFNLSTGASSYHWSFGDGATSVEKEPLHAYQQAGEFQIRLIAINNYGCRDTAELPEKVVALGETLLQLPNAFSPNLSGPAGRKFDPNDQSNDIFHPVIKGTEQYQLSIYSRWGELLFDTRSPDEGWDGYYKGVLCTQDIYIYKIVATFLDGRKIVKTGDILLLR